MAGEIAIERRRQILDGAVRVFARQGFHATRVSDIADEADVAYGLVSVSFHWNNFLWPLIITNSVETRPLTVGLSIFASPDQGLDWAIICAATLMTSGPLLVAFLLFQRHFMQSFMYAGVK